MKVAILVPRLDGGGAEFVALQWATFLGDQGHQVCVLTTHADPEQRPDLDVVALQARSFVARVRQVRRHVRAGRYDAVVGLMPHWNILAVLAAAGLRPAGPDRQRPAAVVSGHNVERSLRRVHGLAYRVELLLARLLYHHAAAFVAVSHPVAAEAAVLHRIVPERLWVVPNPANAKVDLLRPRPPRRYTDEFGSATVTLTVPARLVPQKRPVLAVETAAVLERTHGVRTSVVFFGSGPEEDRLIRRAAELRVEINCRGWVDRWFEVAAADAVVLLPSIAEGFGNVLVEAAAVGVPSVASSQALGVGDAIVPGVTGVLALGSDPESYAAAVLAARELPTISADGWLQRFSTEQSGRCLLRVLHAVVPGAGPSTAAGAGLSRKPESARASR